MTHDESVQRLVQMATDPNPNLQQKVAEAAAARTDPWRWYCRLCGAVGADASRLVRNDQADAHLDTCRPGGRRPTVGTAEAGRLLHVWSY
jgi:hypothetical protein